MLCEAALSVFRTFLLPCSWLCLHLVFCIEVHPHSPFLCSAAPLALSCEFTGRHSQTDECISVKRAGMAVTSTGTVEKQTNPPCLPPSAPLRKLAQAPPIGHKHYRVRGTNSLQKKKKSKTLFSWRKPAMTGAHEHGQNTKVERFRVNDTLRISWRVLIVVSLQKSARNEWILHKLSVLPRWWRSSMLLLHNSGAAPVICHHG